MYWKSPSIVCFLLVAYSWFFLVFFFLVLLFLFFPLITFFRDCSLPQVYWTESILQRAVVHSLVFLIPHRHPFYLGARQREGRGGELGNPGLGGCALAPSVVKALGSHRNEKHTGPRCLPPQMHMAEFPTDTHSPGVGSRAAHRGPRYQKAMRRAGQAGGTVLSCGLYSPGLCSVRAPLSLQLRPGLGPLSVELWRCSAVRSPAQAEAGQSRGSGEWREPGSRH